MKPSLIQKIKYRRGDINLKLPKSCYVAHGGIGTVISSRVIIGNNVYISHHVTIGDIGSKGINDKYASIGGSPVIGDDVFIYAYSSVLGDVVIGDGVVIGAYSLVLDDVPDYCVVVGCPARVVKDINNHNEGKG